MSEKFHLNSILLVTVLGLALAACTKKRDPELSYGADRDLFAIANYKDKNFDLQTNEITAQPDSTKSFSVQKEGHSSKQNEFGFVRFSAKDPLKLIGETQFLAKAQSQYHIRYEFQNDLLKVMKVANKELFSQDELASLVDLGQGQWAIPVVAYSIEYFRVDQKRNDNNEKTSKLELIPLQNAKGATHFRIDLKSKRTASFIAKTTVLPVSFFAKESLKSSGGEPKSEASDWYIGVSTISSNSFTKSMNFNGSIHAFDKFNLPAQRTRLFLTEKGLNFVNVSLDDRIVGEIEAKGEHRNTVLFLPADFKDFKFNDIGRNQGVREEVQIDKSWKDRSYLELKLSEAVIAGDRENLKVSEILDLTIEEGYLSFELLDEAQNARMRISLYNVAKYKVDQSKKWSAKDYIPKKYGAKDQNIFGFFSTLSPNAKESVATTELDPRWTPYLVRFNPDREFIEYRLSKESPAWMEEIFSQSLNSWNQALEKAGVRFRIKFQDEQGQILRGNMGDLRYSLVHTIDHFADSQAFYGGFGPSISDPKGEIVMATAVLNAENLKQGTEKILLRYLRSHQTEKLLQQILNFSLEILPSSASLKLEGSGHQLQFRAQGLRSFNDVSQFPIYNFETGRIEKASKNRLFETREDSKAVTFANQRGDLAGASGSLTSQEIDRQCPALVQQTKGGDQIAVDLAATQEFKSCLFKLLRPRLQSTLLHEIGHNLGLRHNFAASSDVANFYKPVEIQQSGQKLMRQWTSSSVMDYLSFDEDVLAVPGPYDVAAIQWGYTDRVQKVDGKQRSFRYCTDEDLHTTSDPFCAQFDTGYDPQNAIKDLISKYEQSLKDAGFRNGLATSATAIEQATYRAERFLLPMMKFYESWRLLLLKETGVEKSYLEGIATSEEYQKILENLFSPQKYGVAMANWHRSFYEASRLTFSFLMKLALTPDLSCVATKSIESEKQFHLFPFSKIQRSLFEQKGITVLRCDQAEVKEFLKTQKQSDYVSQVGMSFAPLYTDLAKVFESRSGFDRGLQLPEFVGVANDRLWALSLLINRRSFSVQTHRMMFVPNFTDEPPLRDKMATQFIQRVSQGVSLESLGISKDLSRNNKYASIFSTEQELLKYLIPAFKQAVSVPGKDAVNNARLAPYSAKSRIRFDRNESIRCVKNSSTADLCAAKKHKEAIQIIEKIDEIEEVRAQWNPEPAAIEKLKAAITKYFPQKGHGIQLSYQSIYQIRMEIEAIGSKNPRLSEDLSKIVDRLFDGDEAIFFVFAKEKLKEIDDKSEAGSFAEREKLKEPLYKKPMVQWVSLLRPGDFEVLEDYEYYSNLKGAQDYKGLDQEQALARLDHLLKKLAGWRQSYTNDPSEWDAKGDVLLNSLSGSF